MAVIEVGTTRARSSAPAWTVAVLAFLVLAGCTSGGTPKSGTIAAPPAGAIAAGSSAPVAAAPAKPAAAKPTPSAPAKPKPPKPVSKAVVTIAVAGAAVTAVGPVGVRLDAPVAVSVTDGHLTTVTVSTPVAALAGSRDLAGTTWTSAAPLAPASTYTVKATAVDAAGLSTTKTIRFSTLKPTALLRTRIAPLNGETVGVGMPVIIYFNRKVTDKAAVEKRLLVTTSSGANGSWYWMNAKEVHYRPPTYWPAGERVRVDVRLAGIDAGNGLWGAESRSIGFTIGRSHIAVVSASKHTMSVSEDGKVVREFKVSTGRDKFPTSSGVHVVMSKDKVYWMDSATIGIPRDAPGGYYKQVLSSVRISNSGEFVHAAPWSTKDQGLRNVSHGCVNASVADAAWFLRFSIRGDVVNVIGTPRKLQLGNGFADWNVPWSDWVKGSAIEAVA
jgi:lipoprotein-anchoring transpeptidase ErfK/SrfK